MGNNLQKSCWNPDQSRQESQVELPQLQLQLAESDRKRQALLEEMKVRGWGQGQLAEKTHKNMQKTRFWGIWTGPFLSTFFGASTKFKH